MKKILCLILAGVLGWSFTLSASEDRLGEETNFVLIKDKARTNYMVKSGKSKFKFDIMQQGFAWIADNKIEVKMISRMKKGSRIMITGYNQNGSQTIDHYSLLGFTKAYNASKKACK